MFSMMMHLPRHSSSARSSWIVIVLVRRAIVWHAAHIHYDCKWCELGWEGAGENKIAARSFRKAQARVGGTKRTRVSANCRPMPLVSGNNK